MVIRLDIDQIKKIRDDAFECAAKAIEEKCLPELGLLGRVLANEIRAMKDSPVNVLAKGKANV